MGVCSGSGFGLVDSEWVVWGVRAREEENDLGRTCGRR